MPGVGSLRWACTFHASGDANSTQREPVFRWNMGFILHIVMEGTVSQNFDVGPSFHFMESRK